MPNYSGIWSLPAQMQAIGTNSWPGNFYFILYGGINYSAADSFNNSGLFVSPQGTVIIRTNSSSVANQVSYFDNAGTFSSSKTVSSGGNPVLVNSDADPKWWFVAPAYGYNTILNSAPGTLIFANGKGSNGQDSVEIGKVAVNGNGVTALSGAYRSGKVDVPTVYLRNSSGTFIDARGITANGPRNTQYTKIFARTDNDFVWVRADATNEQQSWIVTPTSAVPTSKKQYTGGTGTNINFVYGTIDSSNNLYWAGISGRYLMLMRMNSSRVPTNQITWDLNGGGYTANDLVGSNISMAQYGNYVYTCGCAYLGVSPNRIGYLFVICLNAADLTFVWGKSFTGNFAAAGTNMYTGTLGGSAFTSALGANQYGLWVKWAAGATSATAYLYAMKIPLDGSIVNGTYSVSGKNITVASYTPTITVETPAATYTTDTPTTSALTDYTLVNPTVSNGTTPTATKTFFS